MTTDRPLVVLERVNKYFGPLHVLMDVDLEIQRGQVVVVLGPSGSGKSTLFGRMAIFAERGFSRPAVAVSGSSAPGPSRRTGTSG